MTDMIRAPWTPEQVAALNRFQREGGMHPFTCGGDHTPGSPALVAYADGWRCPQPYGEHCDYQQDWAHAFMANPSAWPKSPFGAAATEATEQEKTTTRVFAALHRSAEQDVTRVINLYERWVKAGPPPLGVSMARWWDARLVELHDAIRPPADEPARTTTKDQP